MNLDIEVFDSFIDNKTYRKLKWMCKKQDFYISDYFKRYGSNSEEQYFLKFLAKQNYANICKKDKKYATDKDLAQFTKADLEQRILHVTGSLRRYVEKRKYNKRIDVIPIIISLFSLAISVYSLHVSLDKGPKNVSIVSWPATAETAQQVEETDYIR